MGERVRPSGDANVPTSREVAEAARALTEAIDRLDKASQAVVARLANISNPVERAKAALEVKRHTAGEVTGATDELFRAAVIEAYTNGRAEHGWYGYGALAADLGLSRPRVQQIVTGTWKGTQNKKPAETRALREDADQKRLVRRLIAAGRTPGEVEEATGLDPDTVLDLFNAESAKGSPTKKK